MLRPLLATLTLALAALAFAPHADAYGCSGNFISYVDQTANVACVPADCLLSTTVSAWASTCPSPTIGTASGYVFCFYNGQPPERWVPDCT